MANYDTLIADARGFYGALDKHNNREWWLEHKTTYDDKLKAPAMALLDEIAPHLAELSGLPVTTKLFRPHRDVRFSKDKTPYNTHLHMMWALDSTARQNPVFFFGIGLDYVSAGAGMMGLDKPVLDDWRKFVDLDTNRVMGIFAALEKDGFKRREPALKRVPAPYDKDHAAADLLRMKGVMASKELGETKALVTDIKAAFSQLWPLNALMLQVAES